MLVTARRPPTATCSCSGRAATGSRPARPRRPPAAPARLTPPSRPPADPRRAPCNRPRARIQNTALASLSRAKGVMERTEVGGVVSGRVSYQRPLAPPFSSLRAALAAWQSRGRQHGTRSLLGWTAFERHLYARMRSLHFIKGAVRERDDPHWHGHVQAGPIVVPVSNVWFGFTVTACALSTIAPSAEPGRSTAIDSTYIKAERSAFGRKGGLGRRRSAARAAGRPRSSTRSPTSSVAPTR